MRTKKLIIIALTIGAILSIWSIKKMDRNISLLSNRVFAEELQKIGF